ILPHDPLGVRLGLTLNLLQGAAELHPAVAEVEHLDLIGVGPGVAEHVQQVGQLVGQHQRRPCHQFAPPEDSAACLIWPSSWAYWDSTSSQISPTPFKPAPSFSKSSAARECTSAALSWMTW